MFYEATTLASATGMLATCLREEYSIDPAPIFAEAGIPLGPPPTPQTRYPLAKMKTLWDLARNATGDEAIGLKVGKYARPMHYYAFGYSWLASSTLLDGMQRLTRYIRVVSTASVELTLTQERDSYALAARFPDEAEAPPKEGIDCGMTSLLALCDFVAEKEIRPVRVELTCPANVHPDAYRAALRAPVEFNARVGKMHFSKETLIAPLPHGTPDVAQATDAIVEQYIETLDPRKVASQVKRLLVDLLPSGKVDQDLVSSRLNRSASTLQRQLQDEGVSYRDVLDSTRRRLAESYLKDRKYSHAQIAFLVGFSDQSNFSRAFKRWTSMSPKQFQESVAN
jgi:AraC-like DNA-binding protein